MLGIFALPYVNRYDLIVMPLDMILLGVPIGLGALLGRSVRAVVPLAAGLFAIIAFIASDSFVGT